jgi:hypothetical protein
VQLTEDMIRISTHTLGARGAVRDRPLVVYVGHHMLKDARGRQRRFTRRSTAFAAAKVFIAEHNQVDMQVALRASALPACAASMGCLCAGHARGNPASDACDTTETPPSRERWTRQGRMLSYDGTEAIHVERHVDENHRAKLSPVQCDAIADYVCNMLNTIDVDALTRIWMRKP